MRHVLAGDIGGTKTVMALFEVDDSGVLRELQSERFSSAAHDGLLPIARAFLKNATQARPRLSVAGAAFGIAGPIVGRKCRTTNLPWNIDADELVEGLGASVELMNDFRAVALGLSHLSPDKLDVLQEGVRSPGGPVAVIGAGTGLGEAVLVTRGDEQVVIETEGGHTDLAPRNELEVELLRFLWERHGRASVERAVSGMGLCALYELLVSRGHVAEDPAVWAEMTRRDRGEVIGEHALRGSDPACVRTVEWFVSLYGSEAGNFALKTLPTGGLYVAGGIAPKLLSKLKDGSFMGAFLDKGRMSPLLARIPVRVVLEPHVGLLGAASRAAVAARARFASSSALA